MNVTYLDVKGEHQTIVMGCYGIGVSRIVTAVVEEYHDEQGITWPEAIAPYRIHLVALPGKGDTAAEVRAAADVLYNELRTAGVAVLYDDRDASPGVKFADADLLGMPVRVTVGAKGLARGVVERRSRATGEQDELALADAASALANG